MRGELRLGKRREKTNEKTTESSKPQSESPSREGEKRTARVNKGDNQMG